MTPLVEDSRKPMSGFLQTFPHAPFPFADTAFYPAAVINPSHAHYSMLNFLSKSLNLEWSCGPLT